MKRVVAPRQITSVGKISHCGDFQPCARSPCGGATMRTSLLDPSMMLVPFVDPKSSMNQQPLLSLNTRAWRLETSASTSRMQDSPDTNLPISVPCSSVANS